MHLAISSESAWTAAPRFVLTGRWAPPAGHLSFYGHLTGGQPCTCGCGGECHDTGLGFFAGDSTLTADAAMQMAIAAYGSAHLNPKQFQNSSWLSQAASAIESAQIGTSGGFGPNCAGQTAQPLNLFKTASGLALGTSAAGVGILSAVHIIPAAAVPIVGWVIAGVGAIITLIGAIFQHHAAAVARDLQFGCSAIPAVNNAFAVLRQGVQNGTIKAADAAAALPQLYAEFMSAGGAGSSGLAPAGIPGGGKAINDSPWCNSNCELSVVVLGMVFYWQAQFQAVAAQQSASASVPSSTGTGASAPTPSAAAAAASGGSYVSTAARPAAANGIPPWIIGLGLLFGAWAVLN